MRTRVKICGVTRSEDAHLAIEQGASALGFNFYSKSPRVVTPSRAAEMIRNLPEAVVPVGVFANETDSARVLGVAEESGVRVLQIHGPSWPDLDKLRERFPLVLAVSVTADFKPESLQARSASAYLLDGFDPNRLGGTGKTFDWSVAREARRFGPIIVAGGLKPENVGDAIRETRPYGVDTASGVESSPGVKDATKLRDFFAAVAAADKS